MVDCRRLHAHRYPPCLFHLAGNQCRPPPPRNQALALTNAFAQRRHVFFRESLCLDGVMQMNGDLRWPQHPVPRPVMLKRAYDTHWHDRNAELLRHAETAVLELIHAPVARPFGLRKNNQAGAPTDGILREPPHAFQIRRAPHIRDRHIAEALHQPAVRRNFEVRFQFPSADELRDGAVQHERVEKIDVVGHEEAGPLRIETGGPHYFHSRARQKSDAAAERALQPIVFARIQKNSQDYQHRRNNEKMQDAEKPKYGAADRQPKFFHMKTSTAAGRMSSARHSTLTTSPSIMTSMGAASLNSTWRTARREASGCLI